MKKRQGWILLAIALVFSGLTAWGVHQRFKARAELDLAQRAAARQTVAVAHPQASQASSELVLPANVQAFLETPLYARTNGYLKKWHADIGAKVRAGQLLAEIDTPEVDQQLLQAEATEAQAAANLDIARKTSERWQALLKTHYVSQQEADQNLAQFHAREADLQAAKAAVQRLKVLQSFKAVRAPFEGTVTARRVDVGALVTDGAAQPLFRIAQAHVLRVYAYVPQAYSAEIQPGLDAELEIPEYPARFAGQVAHTAGAIDPATRTLYTEVQVPNPGGSLLPGAFGRVHFKLRAARPVLTVPANALIFRAQGTQVAVVGDPGGAVRLQAVRLGRDLGFALEVLEGLKPEDWIVLNPADSISDGDIVDVAKGP